MKPVSDNASREDLHKLAEKLLQRRKLEAAEEIAYLLIGLNALDIQAFYVLGEIYQAKKDYPMALKMFNQALIINPSNLEILKTLKATAEEEVEYNRELEAQAAAKRQAEEGEAEAARAATEAEAALPYPAPDNYISLRNILVIHKQEEALANVYDCTDPLHVPDSGQTEISRELQSKAIKRNIPPILISGIHRSGTVYIRNLIAKKLNIPIHFVAINMGYSMDVVPTWVRQFSAGGNVSSEHIFPQYANRLIENGISKIVVHGRNPKQWVVSLATTRHASISVNEDPQDCAIFPELVGLDLRQTIDLHIKRELPWMLRMMQNWLDVSECRSGDLEVQFSMHEDLAIDKQKFFQNFADFFGYRWSEIEPNEDIQRDEKLSNANFRKGKVDEWKSVLTNAQISQIEGQTPDALKLQFGW